MVRGNFLSNYILYYKVEMLFCLVVMISKTTYCSWDGFKSFRIQVLQYRTTGCQECHHYYTEPLDAKSATTSITHYIFTQRWNTFIFGGMHLCNEIRGRTSLCQPMKEYKGEGCNIIFVDFQIAQDQDPTKKFIIIVEKEQKFPKLHGYRNHPKILSEEVLLASIPINPIYIYVTMLTFYYNLLLYLWMLFYLFKTKLFYSQGRSVLPSVRPYRLALFVNLNRTFINTAS